MSDPLFDLEQRFMECWNVVDDIKLLTKHLCDHPRFTGLSSEADDEMANLLIGLEKIYQVKFEYAWETFEEVTRLYRIATNERESLDDLPELEMDDAPVAVKPTYSQPSRNVYYNTQDVWDMVDAPQETLDKKRVRLNDVSPEEWDRVAKASRKL